MKSKLTLAFTLFTAVAVAAILFIRTNNDHLECKNKVTRSTDVNGCTVVTRTHICKEKFSF